MTVVTEEGPKVMFALIVVSPLALNKPLPLVRIIREVPQIVAVPTASELVVRVFLISHEAGPFTINAPGPTLIEEVAVKVAGR
jgi:hypothetical protein